MPKETKHHTIGRTPSGFSVDIPRDEHLQINMPALLPLLYPVNPAPDPSGLGKGMPASAFAALPKSFPDMFIELMHTSETGCVDIIGGYYQASRYGTTAGLRQAVEFTRTLRAYEPRFYLAYAAERKDDGLCLMVMVSKTWASENDPSDHAHNWARRLQEIALLATDEPAGPSEGE